MLPPDEVNTDAATPEGTAADAPADAPQPRRAGTGIRALLDGFTQGDPDEVLPLDVLLRGLGRQTFGVLLLIATLPAFVPIPGVGGAVGGPLVMLVGVQLLFGLRRPWLPRRLAARGPRRSTLRTLDAVVSRWLNRIHRLLRPRLSWLLDHWFAGVFSGLQLLLLGVLLALPIPFTNYLFGGLLLLYALALIERDGVLLLVAWACGLGAIVFFGVTGGALTALLAQWFNWLAQTL